MQERFVDHHLRRTNRNLLALSGVTAAAVLGVLVLCSGYLYNFFAGPFPADAAALGAIKDAPHESRRFLAVKGERIVPTGLQQVTITKSKYTGQERSRRVSAGYGALVFGSRLLLVKVPGEVQGSEFKGEIVPIPDTVRSRVLTSPRMEAAFFPYMLDAGSYRTGGYVGLSVAALLLLLAGVGLARALKRLSDPTQHPLMQRLRALGEASTVTSQIDAEVTQSAGGVRHGDVQMTPNFLFRPSFLGLDVLRLSDLVWVHGKVTQHSTNGIPTGKTFATVLHDSHKATLEVTCRKEPAMQELLAELTRRAPHALFGHSPELEKAWGQAPQTVIEAVAKRKQDQAK